MSQIGLECVITYTNSITATKHYSHRHYCCNCAPRGDYTLVLVRLLVFSLRAQVDLNVLLTGNFAVDQARWVVESIFKYYSKSCHRLFERHKN